MFDHDTFISPLTWRYASADMRHIWSEHHKRRTWRRLWVALAEAQAELGLVTSEQAADLRAHADQVDVDRALEIEAAIKHDLMAEIKAFAEQCPVGGGIVHLGATSADIEDNADALRLRESLDLVLKRLRALLARLAEQIDARSPPVEVYFAEGAFDEAPTGVVTGDGSCFRQIEFVGILQGTQQRELAEQWVDFMLGQTFQEDIPLKMFVFPANGRAELPEVFRRFAIVPENPAGVPAAAIEENREAWIEAWTQTVLR